MRVPLYVKILGWFLLNLVLIAGVGAWFLHAQLGLNFTDLLSGTAGKQVQAAGRLIEADLLKQPRESWPALLARYNDAYGVEFSVYRPDGAPLAAGSRPLPREVRERFPRMPGGQPMPPPQGPPPAPGDSLQQPPPPPQKAAPARGGPIIHTREPDAYWALVPIDMPPPHPAEPMRHAVLVIRADSLGAGGMFFDPRPWLFCGVAMVGLSALFWLPFVGRITRAISQMTQATQRIADGHFDVKLGEGSRDELGLLARSINRMAARLDGFVSGQKRFLGDIAHELCAPLARMQLALGILETREKESTTVADLREEADDMNALVSELLAFSKASLAPTIQTTAVDVALLVGRVAKREGGSLRDVAVHVPDGLHVRADEHLLERALANLVRNALRHSTGTVEVTGSSDDDEVRLTVADDGPGVPPEAIERIFEPFFRLDPSRNRDTGGAGLGLAIVRTCIESCGGRVTCRNRQPTGLEVTLHLVVG